MKMFKEDNKNVQRVAKALEKYIGYKYTTALEYASELEIKAMEIYSSIPDELGVRDKF
jgi:hypothetical protein